MSFRRLFIVLALSLSASALLTSMARAELSPLERATAEALFQDGVQRMDEGDYAAACEKFAGTLELEPGLGTMLHLADCYDRLGRTASSWALFEEVASRAKLADDKARETIATARANELKARLSLVQLELNAVVDDPRVRARIEVTIGETLIPAAMWGSSIPLDPGQQRLSVAAEGYEPWFFSLVVAPGPSLRRVTVPPLTRQLAVVTKQPALVRPIANALPQVRLAEDSKPSSTPRILGYISGALGLVGLGVSGYFGYRAYRSQHSSLDSCRASNPNRCTPEGVEQREDAFRYAEVANVSAIAGGACLLVGTTLLIVSPTSADAPSNVAWAGKPGSGGFRTPTVWLRRDW